MGAGQIERFGALLLGSILIFGIEAFIVLAAFGEGRSSTVCLWAAGVSLVLAMPINASTKERKGRTGVFSALAGAIVTIAIIMLYPKGQMTDGLALALAICLISSIWLVPHMAGQQLMAGALMRLKERLPAGK